MATAAPSGSGPGSGPDPAVAAWDGGGTNGLDAILGHAFGIAGGYQDFNRILSAIGFDMFQQLGLYDHPMLVVVSKVRTEIQALGQINARTAQRVALEALYTDLVGNAELRAFVEAHVPDMLAAVSASDFEAARQAYESNRLEQRVRGISRDLTAIAAQVTLGAADKQLAREIVERLDELSGFKRIHDTLHQLQMAVMAEFLRLASDTIVPADRQLSVMLQIEELKLAIDRIRPQFTAPASSPAAVQARSYVLQQIGGIVTLIAGMDGQARATAETAAQVLRSLLRQQMSLFDSQLVNASEQIPFAKFAASFAQLAPLATVAVAQGENPVLIANVSSGFDAVALRLVTRQTVHRLWQQTEATILNVEELLGGTGREIEIRFHWQNVQGLIGDLAKQSVEPDVATLLAIPGLDLALSAKPEDIRADRFRSAFTAFSSFVRVRFQRADSALLEDCGVLRLLNNPLQALL